MEDYKYNFQDSSNLIRPVSFWQDLLNKLQISGNIENEQNQNINTVYGGGRLGYNFPLENNNSLDLGLLGSGYKVTGNSPYGKINESKIGLTGLDALYKDGQSSYGINYQRSPVEGNIINLLYNRQF